jgi:hypothetical protein
MTLRLNGTTSGYTEIDAPLVAGNNTIVLPSSNGSANQLLKNGSTAGSLEFSSNVFIDSSGRLGVGTSSPTQLLTVGGTTTPTVSATPTAIRLDNTYTGSPATNQKLKFYLYNDGSESYGITVGDAADFQYWAGGTATGIHRWFTSNTERMRINAAGNVLFNTTSAGSAGGVNGQHTISHSTSSQWSTIVQHTVAAGSVAFGLGIKYTAATPNNTSSEFLYCEDATALRASIRSNGGLANFQANNVNLSDRNAKKDITPVADTWKYIKEWEIVNYRYKDQPDDADLNLGVIAQQVAENCPEVITVFQEAKEATEDAPAKEERLGVKEQQMYWMAIKALQEAQVRIETLEAANAALETRLAALEAQQ